MRRRRWIALAVLTIGVALWATLRQGRPRPESFEIDESLPAGAVRRIGSRMFGRVGGANRPLVALSPDGSRVYTCDDDGLLRAWDADRGAPLWQVAAHVDAVPPSADGLERQIERTWRSWTGSWHATPRDSAVSPDGRRIATCAGAMIRVFDAASGDCVAEHRVEREVDYIRWTPDGRRLLRAEKDVLVAWDVEDDAEVRSEPFASEYIEFNGREDGTIVVLAESTPSSPVTLLDGTTLARKSEFARPPSPWRPSLTFDKDGRCRAFQWPTKERRRWIWGWHDPGTGEVGETFESEGMLWRVLENEPGAQRALVLGPSALELVQLGGSEATVVARGGVTMSGGTLSQDGRRFAWGALGRARVHDLAAGRRLHPDELLLDPAHMLVLPDGARVVVPAEDAWLAEIAVETGRVLRRFDAGGAQHDELKLSADARFVAGMSTRGAFRVDLETAAAEHWQMWSNNLAFRGSELIGLLWKDQEIAVQTAATGAQVPLEHGASSSMGNVVWSADGTRVRADVKKGTFVWDTATGKEVDEPLRDPPQLRLATPPRGDQAIHDVGPNRAVVRPADRFDPDSLGVARLAQGAAFGTTLIAIPQNASGRRARSSRQSRIALVAADDGRTVAWFTAQDGPILTLAFVPGGRFLLSGHDDGTILVWDLTALPLR